MKITRTQSDGRALVRIEGDLIIASVAEAKAEMLAALAANGPVEADLGGVEDCDTAGIQFLLMARAQNKQFTLGARSPAVQAAMERIGIAPECFAAQARESRQ